MNSEVDPVRSRFRLKFCMHAVKQSMKMQFWRIFSLRTFLSPAICMF